MAHPQIPGLPAGWKVLLFIQSTLHPREAVVLCEREPHSDVDLNYVTWKVNTIEGGCHNGDYFDLYTNARASFNNRVSRLG